MKLDTIPDMLLQGPLLDVYRNEPHHAFGLLRLHFSLDERDPIVVATLGHYRIPGEIEIVFRSVVYHAVMSESYVYLRGEDAWDLEAFLAEAKSSQLVKYVAGYTLLGSTDEVFRAVGADHGQLRHFRVMAQNYFVEIIAREAPTIEVKHEA